MAKLTGVRRLRHRSLRELLKVEESKYAIGLRAYVALVSKEFAYEVKRYSEEVSQVAAGKDFPRLLSDGFISTVKDMAVSVQAGAADRFAGGDNDGRGVPKRDHGVILDAYAIGLAVATDPRKLQQSIGLVQALRKAKSRLKKASYLTRVEELAIGSVQDQAWLRIRSIAEQVVQQTMDVFATLEEDLVVAVDRMIQREVESTIAERSTVRTLESRLMHATKDWTRDWRRIAMTEVQSAMQAGVVAGVKEEYGEDAIVVKIPRPDACDQCRRLYLGPDGTPRKMRLSELEDNGHDNTGRKRGQWQAVVGAVHPHCSCETVHMLEGMDFEGELADLSNDSTQDKGLRMTMSKAIPSHVVPGEDVLNSTGMSSAGGGLDLWVVEPPGRADMVPIVDTMVTVEGVGDWLERWRAKMVEKRAALTVLGRDIRPEPQGHRVDYAETVGDLGPQSFRRKPCDM